MKRAYAAMAMLLLAGCSAGSDRWTKPGISADAADADYAECESQARSATQRDAGIDADIMATRGTDWQRTGTFGMKRDEMANANRAQARQIIGRCMAAKGYAPAP